MSESKQISLKVTLDAKGTRLDLWLGNIPEIGSRNQATKLIEKNLVKVSGVLPLKVKGSYRLQGNEAIEIDLPPPEESLVTPENIPLDVIYEDDDIIVINKPAGMVCHPGAGNRNRTLVNALVYRFKELSNHGGADRPGLVHRLDKNTSGVLVVAKNNKAHQGLAEQFQIHDIHRIYWALVVGLPKRADLTIMTKLARHPIHRMAFSSQEVGKEAITHYKFIKSYNRQVSLLHVSIETGRTHQIRVHLHEMGNPVVKDSVYGLKRQSRAITAPAAKKLIAALPRQALHAAELGFHHPRTKKKMIFSAPWPEDLQKFINELEKFAK